MGLPKGSTSALVDPFFMTKKNFLTLFFGRTSTLGQLLHWANLDWAKPSRLLKDMCIVVRYYHFHYEIHGFYFFIAQQLNNSFKNWCVTQPFAKGYHNSISHDPLFWLDIITEPGFIWNSMDGSTIKAVDHDTSPQQPLTIHTQKMIPSQNYSVPFRTSLPKISSPFFGKRVKTSTNLIATSPLKKGCKRVWI